MPLPEPSNRNEPRPPPGQGVVNCVAYDHAGKRRGDIDIDDISRVMADPDVFVWVGLHEPDESLLEKLQKQFDLHDLAIEDAHSAHQRTKIEAYGESLFMVVQTAQLNQGTIAFGETTSFSARATSSPCVTAPR